MSPNVKGKAMMNVSTGSPTIIHIILHWSYQRARHESIPVFSSIYPPITTHKGKVMASRSKYRQGKFRPKNPQKYAGDPTEIYWRSSWELVLMSRLDTDPSILKWNSECEIIPYRNPETGRLHRYFPDFKIWTKGPDGFEQVTIIEVKPYKETSPPDPANSRTKTGKPRVSFLRESATYAKNHAKWEAAREYCAKRRYKFIIMTEYELGLKKRQ